MLYQARHELNPYIISVAWFCFALFWIHTWQCSGRLLTCCLEEVSGTIQESICDERTLASCLPDKFSSSLVHYPIFLHLKENICLWYYVWNHLNYWIIEIIKYWNYYSNYYLKFLVQELVADNGQKTIKPLFSFTLHKFKIQMECIDFIKK